MGVEDTIREIDRREVERKINYLKKLVEPSEKDIFKLAEPIAEYDEFDYISSSGQPDRKVIKILFEDGTSAVFYINTQSQQPQLIKAFKRTTEGIQIVTPVSQNPRLNQVEFKTDTSAEAVRGYLKELHLGTPVKPVTRYVARPRQVS